MTRLSGTPTQTSVCEASIRPDSNASGTTSEAPAALSGAMSASSRARTITGTEGFKSWIWASMRTASAASAKVSTTAAARAMPAATSASRRRPSANTTVSPAAAASRTRSGSRSSAT